MSGALLYYGNHFGTRCLSNVSSHNLTTCITRGSFSTTAGTPKLVIGSTHGTVDLLSTTFCKCPRSRLGIINVAKAGKGAAATCLARTVLGNYSNNGYTLFSSISGYLSKRACTRSSLAAPRSVSTFHVVHRTTSGNVRCLIVRISSRTCGISHIFKLAFSITTFLGVDPSRVDPVRRPAFRSCFRYGHRVMGGYHSLILNATYTRTSLVHRSTTVTSVPVATFTLNRTSTTSIAT